MCLSTTVVEFPRYKDIFVETREFLYPILYSIHRHRSGGGARRNFAPIYNVGKLEL